MKTNPVLKSKDRVIFGVTIRQEAKTGFLSLTDLQKAYNNEAIKNFWGNKPISRILQTKDNWERIFYILKEQGLIKVGITTFIEAVEKEGITKVLKRLKVYKTQGARQAKIVMVDAYIWMLVALEMHPELYAKTVIWLADSLLAYRIGAGDTYRGLTAAMQEKWGDQMEAENYAKVARGLNIIVFGKHQKGMRNTGTAEQLKKLEKVESNLVFAIDSGLVSSYPNLIQAIAKLIKKSNNY